MKYIILSLLLVLISCIHNTAKKADLSSCYLSKDIDAIEVKYDSIFVDFEKNKLFLAGWIYDSEMNEQIVDASVSIKSDSEKKKVLTDIDGFFKLNYDGDLTNTRLVVSYIGYKNFEVPINQISK